MCSKTSIEAVLSEHRNNLNGLALHCQQLERQQEKLIEETQRLNSVLRELLVGHRDLEKEHWDLWQEHGALRDCLDFANLVPKRVLQRSLSRRRAPKVLKVVVEEPGLALSLGIATGVVGTRNLCETSRGLGAAMRRCLPALAKRQPPEIYVLGGKNDSSSALVTAECYSPLTGQWRVLPPMRTPRYGCAAAAVNGMLYVVGGHDGYKTLATVERFDPSMETWVSLPNMLTARSRCAAASVRGMLHVIGGRGNDSRAPQVALPTERFDPCTGVWQALPPMPLAPLGCAAAVLGGTLYCVGVGADRNMVVECFDSRSTRWTCLTPVPRQRFGCAATTVAGCFYVAGGHDGQKAVAELERFNPKLGRWEPLPAAPSARHGCAAVAAAGSLYLVGGDDGQGLSALERFDPGSGLWYTLPALPTGRFGCAAAGVWR
eukprot:TRINITY_DN92269_c0_g1_i1.p1 TRINITY_DN92269_c0_g1~~TRINITY_DN92269_c0_g1_i1.p1  ORF type:complete len:432 (+),score=81.18 TRINITY_DN92269_c0_g1_i1:51-1346(+)